MLYLFKNIWISSHGGAFFKHFLLQNGHAFFPLFSKCASVLWHSHWWSLLLAILTHNKHAWFTCWNPPEKMPFSHHSSSCMLTKRYCNKHPEDVALSCINRFKKKKWKVLGKSIFLKRRIVWYTLLWQTKSNLGFWNSRHQVNFWNTVWLLVKVIWTNINNV